MEYRDYYQILGVPRTASQAEVKKAFRKLAREHHPDRNPNDAGAEKRFKDVNEAHAVLADPEKRKQYDLMGASWEQYQRAGGGRPGADPFGPGGPFADFGFGGTGTSPGAGRRGGVRYEFRTAGAGTEGGGGFSDFFRMFFSGASAGASAARGGSGTGQRAAGRRSGAEPTLEEILAEMGMNGDVTGGAGTAGTGRATRPKPRPAEIEAPAELTLEEAFHGTTRLVEVEGRRYEVQIPRGADTGSRIRLSGKGPDGRDIVVTVRLRAHAVYTRRGADLERELPVTLREALLGAEVPVASLGGRLLLTIPAGTQNGKTFRLTGRGMPRLKGEGPGDLYLKIRVVLPAKLDDETLAAARRFLDLAAQPDPRPAT